ncbi:MAG: tRNA guanosine(15) transglycosylase TgtA, partial [Methanobacteriota archaeon]
MFKIRQRDGLARIGRLMTPHGALTTPTLLPVVNPRKLTLKPAEIRDCGATGLITNSYIISRHDELRERALADGVHALVGWDGPLMTDSGTFQSHVYGDIEVEPQAIVEFQRDIGSDIGTVLDVFTEPEFDADRAEAELAETQARIAAAVPLKGEMLLAATVQGGSHPALRERAAAQVSTVDADMHPIGGVVPLMEQYRYAELATLVLAAKRALVPARPVHLFGCGHPSLFALAALLGCDLFDSASYAKFAADGRMMFSWGTRRLTRRLTELEELPCGCAVCSATTTDALAALSDAERERQLARHNLLVSFAELRRVRQAIRDGLLWELVASRAADRPEVADALVALEPHGDWLEQWEPAFRPRQPTAKREALLRFARGRLTRTATGGASFEHPLFGTVPEPL